MSPSEEESISSLGIWRAKKTVMTNTITTQVSGLATIQIGIFFRFMFSSHLLPTGWCRPYLFLRQFPKREFAVRDSLVNFPVGCREHRLVLRFEVFHGDFLGTPQDRKSTRLNS